MIRRDFLPVLRDALRDSRVVLVQGARQTGKTTLANMIASECGGVVHTLDLTTTRAAAESDPVQFVESAGARLMVIDEVQKLPELFPALKVVVDRDPRPGRFLLTGSASVLALPRLADSLAGRMRVLTLWPLSQREIHADGDRATPTASMTFIDRLFAERLDAIGKPPDNQNARPHAEWLRAGGREPFDVRSAAIQGGFPERIDRTDPALNRGWYQGYLTTILERDVRDLAEIRAPIDLLRLLTMVATRSGSILNNSDLSRSLGLVDTTLKRYLTLLEKVFLVARLPAWTTNLDQRLVKSPKVYITDSGLFAHLIEIDRERLNRDPTLSGPLVETFVFTELTRQLGVSRTRASIHHFRTPDRREVDFVLERAAGQIVGVEVKAAATVTRGDFKGLDALRSLAGARFIRGVVLHTGTELVPFGPQMWAVPIRAMWSEE